MAYKFLQSLFIDDVDVGVQGVVSLTFIERLNLTCPKLIMTLSDRNKIYQDNGKVADGTRLDLVLGDPSGRGEELFKESFIVGANWAENDNLIIEAMQADIHRIKQPVSKPMFFVDKTVRQILSSVFPEHEIVMMDSYEFKHTYHVLNGSTIAVMLETLKWDAGAEIYIDRGKIVFRLLKSFYGDSDAFQFDYLRNSSPNPTIVNYSRQNPRHSVLRAETRDYMCWDMTRGLISQNAGNPRQFLPHTHESQLKNHNVSVIPVMECTLAGDGRFKPALMIKLELNRMLPEAVIDESVPSRQLMTGVRHFQQGQKYICVCEFGEVIDAN